MGTEEREWQVSVIRYFVQHVAELMRAVQVATGVQPDEDLVTFQDGGADISADRLKQIIRED